jgi:hypothetical protein
VIRGCSGYYTQGKDLGVVCNYTLLSFPICNWRTSVCDKATSIEWFNFSGVAGDGLLGLYQKQFIVAIANGLREISFLEEISNNWV